jgi:hypothetical protein
MVVILHLWRKLGMRGAVPHSQCVISLRVYVNTFILTYPIFVTGFF